MLVAQDAAGARVEACRHTPPGQYRCPTCHSPVVAKPGRIKIPHFAHTTTSDCPSAGESIDHLHAKKVLAERFRAVGYGVALEEPHPRERRVDVAVTLAHPLRPLRYAVEVQNSAIDPREMFRRLVADLEAGFSFTAWVFTGRRAAPLLAAAEGAEVRLPADVVAEEHLLSFPDKATSRHRFTDLVGMQPGDWVGERLAPGSYGWIGQLYGVKCLDPEGRLWSVQFDKVARRNQIAGGTTAPLRSIRRITKKTTIPFDLFGPAIGPGDRQRVVLATALAESFTDASTALTRDAFHDFAATVFNTRRTAELDEWVSRTVESMSCALPDTMTEDHARRIGRRFLEAHERLMYLPPCGWMEAPIR